MLYVCVGTWINCDGLVIYIIFDLFTLQGMIKDLINHQKNRKVENGNYFNKEGD